MTQAANNYGQVLYELKVPKEIVEEAEVLFREVPQLKEALVSPVVKKSDKNRVIDRVFPAELRNFLKVLCGHQDLGEVEDVFEAYHAYACEQEGSLRATLYYVTEPDAEQLKKIKQMLMKKYQKQDVELRLVKDSSLGGGFVIRTGDMETDWSIKGRMKQLEQILMRR